MQKLSQTISPDSVRHLSTMAARQASQTAASGNVRCAVQNLAGFLTFDILQRMTFFVSIENTNDYENNRNHL